MASVMYRMCLSPASQAPDIFLGRLRSGKPDRTAKGQAQERFVIEDPSDRTAKGQAQEVLDLDVRPTGLRWGEPEEVLGLDVRRTAQFKRWVRCGLERMLKRNVVK